MTEIRMHTDTVMALAQAAPLADPIAGGAGWVGAGLLGMVLSWLLLKHLPEQVRQQKEDREGHDKHVKELMQAKDEAVRFALAEFRAEAREQRQDAREVLDTVCAEFRNDMERERTAHTARLEHLARTIEGGCPFSPHTPVRSPSPAPDQGQGRTA